MKLSEFTKKAYKRYKTYFSLLRLVIYISLALICSYHQSAPSGAIYRQQKVQSLKSMF